jgi:hypothetical protein
MGPKVAQPWPSDCCGAKPSLAVQAPPRDDDPCFDILPVANMNVKKLTKMSLEQNMIDE